MPAEKFNIYPEHLRETQKALVLSQYRRNGKRYIYTVRQRERRNEQG